MKKEDTVEKLIKTKGLEAFDIVYNTCVKKKIAIPNFGVEQAPTGWGKTLALFSAQIKRLIKGAKHGKTRVINVTNPFLTLSQQNAANIIKHLYWDNPDTLKRGCLIINSSDSANNYSLDDEILDQDYQGLPIEPYSNLENILENNLYDFVIIISCNKSMGKHIKDLKTKLKHIDEYVLIDECHTVGNVKSKIVGNNQVLEALDEKVYFDIDELHKWVESIIGISATPESWLIKKLNSFENPSMIGSMNKIVEVSFPEAEKSGRVIAPTDFIGIEVEDINDISERRDAIVKAIKISKEKGIETIRMMLNNPYDTEAQEALSNELYQNKEIKVDNIYSCSSEYGYKKNGENLVYHKGIKSTNGNIIDFCETITEDDSDYIVSQMGKMNAGVDIKPINIVFLNSLSGNINDIAIMTIQRIGRGTRTGSEQKDKVLVFFLYTKDQEEQCWENVNILNKDYYNSNKMVFTLVRKNGKTCTKKLEVVPNERTFTFNKSIKDKFAVSLSQLNEFKGLLKQFTKGIGLFRRIVADVKDRAISLIKNILDTYYKSRIDFVSETEEHRIARKWFAKHYKLDEEELR